MTDTNQSLPADTERFAKFHPADKLEELSVECRPVDIRTSAQIAVEGFDTPSWWVENQQIPG